MREVGGVGCGVEVEKHLDILTGGRERLVQTVDRGGLAVREGICLIIAELAVGGRAGGAEHSAEFFENFSGFGGSDGAKAR